MKKIAVFLLILLCTSIFLQVAQASIIVRENTTTGTIAAISDHWDSTGCAHAQNMTVNWTTPVSEVSFKLAKNIGSPTNNLTAEIRTNISSGEGTLIASSSTILNASTLSGTQTWYNFSFANVLLTYGSGYAFVLRDAAEGGLVSGSHNAGLSVNTSNPLADGAVYSLVSGSWYYHATWDALFIIYSEPNGYFRCGNPTEGNSASPTVFNASDCFTGLNFTFIDNVVTSVTITNIYTRMWIGFAAPYNWTGKAALYAENLTLLESTDELTLYRNLTSFALANFTLATPQTLMNNTVYHFVLWGKETAGALSNIYYSDFSLDSRTTFRMNGQPYNGTFPTSLGSPTYTAKMIDIFSFYQTTEIFIIGGSWRDAWDPPAGLGLAANHPSTSVYSSAAGETFQVVSGNFILTKVQLSINTAYGHPTGTDASVKIYAITGTYGVDSVPTGSPLASTNNFDCRIADGSVSNFTTFQFQDGLLLLSGSLYAVVYQNPSGTSINSSNYMGIHTNSTGDYSGNSFRYRDGIWNTTYASWDLNFAVYGVPALEYSVSFYLGAGGSSLSVNGTSVSNSTVWNVLSGNVLQVQATPAFGYRFYNLTWSSWNVSVANPAYLTITENTTVWAYFIEGSVWLSGWQYRKSHVLMNVSGADTGYPFWITIINGTGSDSASTVYIGNKINSDFSDIRFTRADATTLLGYSRESYYSQINATFVISVSDNLTSSPRIIFIYYGKPSASYIGDPDQVYGFYDDFLGTSLNTTKWDTVDSEGNFAWTVHDSKIDVINTKYDTRGTRWGFTHTGFPYQENFKVTISNLYVWTGTNPLDPIYDWGVVLCNTSSPWDGEISAYYDDSAVGDYANNNSRIGSSTYSSAITSSSVENANIIITKLGSNVTIYWNGVIVLSENTSITLEKILIEASCLQIIYQIYPFPAHATLDLLSVRRFVDPEPTHGSWGSEEEYVVALLVDNLPTDVGSVDFTLNGTSHSTPYTDSDFDAGIYIFAYSSGTVTKNSSCVYGFDHWAVTNSSGSFNLTAATIILDISEDTHITLTYSGVYVAVSSNPEINASFSEANSGLSKTTPSTIFIPIGAANFTVNTLSYSPNATHIYIFDHWLVNGSASYSTQSLSLSLSGDTNLSIVYTLHISVYVSVSSLPEINAAYSELNLGLTNTTPSIMVLPVGAANFTLSTITYSPNASYTYTFSHWLVNGTDIYGSYILPLTLGGDTTLEIVYSGSSVYTPFPFSYPHDALNLTWYFRSDIWTILETLGYKLQTVNTNTATSDMRTDPLSKDVSYGFRVFVKDVLNATTELTTGTPEAIMLVTTNTSGMQTAYWNCPSFSGLVSAVKINVYQRFNDEAWSLRRVFISRDDLLWKFPAATWTFHFYINRTAGSTYSTMWHGSYDVYDSRVDLQYYKADPWETAMARLWQMDLLGFLFMPWTYWLGDIFWTLLLFGLIVTSYTWTGSLKLILAILWILGGSGSVLWAMIPAIALHVAALMLAIAMAWTFFRLVYGRR
jgi:hypothetical protein